eukprot:GFUD01016903.1.p1 GENE.GFUD01016903.1~~GFUD01016903.1.p1  ORF type:complete len:248 (+),score=50.29 GFUD01016903.1:117-860(+)
MFSVKSTQMEIVVISCLATGFASSLECHTQLSRDSFSCCFFEANLPNYSNCAYNDGECSAGEYWGTDEEDCNSFDWTKKYESPFEIECTGQKEYPNNVTRIKWNCPKPVPDPKKAEVILDPVPGNLDLDSERFFLSIKLDRSFPEPVSTIQFDNKVDQEPFRKDHSTDTDMEGLITVTEKYYITLRKQKIKFIVVITQDGFEDQKFEYTGTVISNEENSDTQTVGSVAGILISLCFIFGRNNSFNIF